MTSNSGDRNILIWMGLILLVPLVFSLFMWQSGDTPIPATPSPTFTWTPTLKPILPSMTPTCEWACQLTVDAALYRDRALTDVAAHLIAGQNLLLTNDYTESVWWVVTADGERFEGYLSREVLPDDCP